MSFSVVTNLPSLNAQARLQETSVGLQQTLNRLTSGLRINRAADDAAGLAVANRHRLDNAGLQVGIRNANDAISKLQVEDGAMGNISSLLDRALTLAGQAASDTFSGSRTTLNNEFQSILSEITRFSLTVPVDAAGLGLSTQDITNTNNAAAAVAAIQLGVGTLGNAQGTACAAMNRLQFAVTQGQTLSVSTSASESLIRDADMAQEATNLTKHNILMQSGMAALGQANQSAQAVLTLLR